METVVTLDGNRLKKVADASHSAKVTIQNLIGRERFRNSSDITRLKRDLIKEGRKIVDKDYIQFWKDLQDAGVGSIVYGRRGKADRFEWHYSLKKVAEAASQGKNTEVPTLKGVKNSRVILRKRGRPPGSKNLSLVPNEVTPTFEDAPVETNKPRANMSSAERILVIPLRSDYFFNLTVPLNLTKAEAEVIANALISVTE